MERVDETYEIKMAGFEIDCNNGTGVPAACHHTGEYFAAVKEDHKRAAAIYYTNCNDKKYPLSCFNLGRYYLTGKGMEQDDKKALESLDFACKGGILPACHFQGMLLHSGLLPPGSQITAQSPMAAIKEMPKDGVIPKVAPVAPKTPEVVKSAAQLAEDKKNRALAMEVFEKACAGGEINSCYFLGTHFMSKGPERSPAKALKYFEVACEANHGPSCHYAAVMYNKGDVGVDKNPELFEKYKLKTTELVQLAGNNLKSAF